MTKIRWSVIDISSRHPDFTTCIRHGPDLSVVKKDFFIIAPSPHTDIFPLLNMSGSEQPNASFCVEKLVLQRTKMHEEAKSEVCLLSSIFFNVCSPPPKLPRSVRNRLSGSVGASGPGTDGAEALHGKKLAEKLLPLQLCRRSRGTSPWSVPAEAELSISLGGPEPPPPNVGLSPPPPMVG